MLKRVLFITLFWSIMQNAFAQQRKPETWMQFALGAGIGLDYGGLGVKFEYAPIPHLAVFGAARYNDK